MGWAVSPGSARFSASSNQGRRFGASPTIQQNQKGVFALTDTFFLKPKTQVKENIWTLANFITTARVAICSIIFYTAFEDQNTTYLYAGLLIHSALDILDGYFARLLKQETLLGAQIDILADRLLIIFFYMVFCLSHPSLRMPVMLFLFEFVFLDAYLSLQFLNWGITSPNYFHKVDKLIWALNWSPLAKAINSSLVTILLIIIGEPNLASIIVLCLISIKIYSFIRLQWITDLLLKTHQE